jgi:hypothetical protein
MIKTQVIVKRRARSQIANLIPNHWKSRIALTFLCDGGVPHIVAKLLMRATTFSYTSLQSKVCTQSYGPPKPQESKCWKFRDSHLGVQGQNDIWMLVPWPRIYYKGECGGFPQVWPMVSLVNLCFPWPGIKYIIKGKVGVSPKFGSWWVLWIRVSRGQAQSIL